MPHELTYPVTLTPDGDDGGFVVRNGLSVRLVDEAA